MAVYKREDIPAHFHYRHNTRIMPILLEAKEGWTIVQNRTGQSMRTYREEPSVLRLFLRGFRTTATAFSIYSISAPPLAAPRYTH